MRHPTTPPRTRKSRAKPKEEAPELWGYPIPASNPMTREEVIAANEEAWARKHAPPKPPRPRKPTTCTISAGHNPGSPHRVPTLRLRGHWLAEMGFVIGSKLRISVEEGRLVVRLDAE